MTGIIASVAIVRVLEDKIGRLLLETGRRRDQIEIVLGKETESLLLKELRLWRSMAAVLGEPASLHGTKMMGVRVVVDTATPRLTAVRPIQSRLKSEQQ